MEAGYFDYSGKSSYGKTTLPLSEYTLLIHTGVNAALGIFDIEFHFYYRIADGFIEFAIESFVEEAEEGACEIVGRFKIENEIGKSELLAFLRQWIIGGKLYYGLNHNYFSSPLISKKEFADFNNEILAEQKTRQTSSIERYKNEPIVEYCISNKYELIVSTENENIIETFCPNGSHHIMINAESGSWFCGYCGKSGVFEDFVEFVEKSHRPSHASHQKDEGTSESAAPNKEHEYWLLSSIIIILHNMFPKKAFFAHQSTIDKFQLHEVEPLEGNSENSYLAPDRNHLIIYELDNNSELSLPLYDIEQDGHSFIMIKGNSEAFQIKLFELKNRKPIMIKDFI